MEHGRMEGRNCISSGFMRPPVSPFADWLARGCIYPLYIFVRSHLPPVSFAPFFPPYSLSPSRPSFIRCAHYRAYRRPPLPPWRRFASTSCPPHTQLWHGQTTQHASSVRPRACRPNIEWSLSTFNAEREEVPKWWKKKREKDGKLSKKRRCSG